jgi:hypothetical protein
MSLCLVQLDQHGLCDCFIGSVAVQFIISFLSLNIARPVVPCSLCRTIYTENNANIYDLCGIRNHRLSVRAQNLYEPYGRPHVSVLRLSVLHNSKTEFEQKIYSILSLIFKFPNFVDICDWAQNVRQY